MEARLKQIYEIISKRDNVPIDLIESVGNSVFDSLRYHMDHPSELAYELPKIGTFNIRFNRFLGYYNTVQKKLANKEEKTTLQKQNDPELFERLDKLNLRVEEYREKKQEKRNERNEYLSKTSEDKLD
jgi:hypothetical protein